MLGEPLDDAQPSAADGRRVVARSGRFGFVVVHADADPRIVAGHEDAVGTSAMDDGVGDELRQHQDGIVDVRASPPL